MLSYCVTRKSLFSFAKKKFHVKLTLDPGHGIGLMTALLLLKHTLLEAAVPKLSSSEAVSVVIFPVTPEMWNNRSPSSCTELNL